jgi:hypothetical protein
LRTRFGDEAAGEEGHDELDDSGSRIERMAGNLRSATPKGNGKGARRFELLHSGAESVYQNGWKRKPTGLGGLQRGLDGRILTPPPAVF